MYCITKILKLSFPWKPPQAGEKNKFVDPFSESETKDLSSIFKGYSSNMHYFYKRHSLTQLYC